MFSTIVKRVVGLGALVMLLAVIANAQTAQVEGTVKIKDADGAMKPVPGVHRNTVEQLRLIAALGSAELHVVHHRALIGADPALLQS